MVIWKDLFAILVFAAILLLVSTTDVYAQDLCPGGTLTDGACSSNWVCNYDSWTATSTKTVYVVQRTTDASECGNPYDYGFDGINDFWDCEQDRSTGEWTCTCEYIEYKCCSTVNNCYDRSPVGPFVASTGISGQKFYYVRGSICVSGPGGNCDGSSAFYKITQCEGGTRNPPYSTERAKWCKVDASACTSGDDVNVCGFESETCEERYAGVIGTSCNNGRLGVCYASGFYVCDGSGVLVCDAPVGPSPQPAEVCSDSSSDFDCDGSPGCFDSGCALDSACLGVEVCNNDLDDDLDGAVDCADVGCSGSPYCVPGVESLCSNGLDDEGDGLVDCGDGDCSSHSACLPPEGDSCGGLYGGRAWCDNGGNPPPSQFEAVNRGSTSDCLVCYELVVGGSECSSEVLCANPCWPGQSCDSPISRAEACGAGGDKRWQSSCSQIQYTCDLRYTTCTKVCTEQDVCVGDTFKDYPTQVTGRCSADGSSCSASCAPVLHDQDEGQGYCLSGAPGCGPRFWRVAGEGGLGDSNPSQGQSVCCTDDGGEFVRSSSGPGSFEGFDGSSVCCDSSTDCVFGSRCYVSGVVLEGDRPASPSCRRSGNDLFGYFCSSGNWRLLDVDGDGTDDSCDDNESNTCSTDGFLTNCGNQAGFGCDACVVTGKVTNVTGDYLVGVRVRRLGDPLMDGYSNSTGDYWIAPVPVGLADFEASMEEYDSTSIIQYLVNVGVNKLDFLLQRGPYVCESDCTTVGSNVCRAGCAGVNGCPIQVGVNEFCDGRVSGFSYDFPGGLQVVCCGGVPYSPVRAVFSVDSDNVLRVVRPVLYQGRFVNLVVDIFD